MRGWKLIAPLAFAGLMTGILFGAVSACSSPPKASETVDGYVALVPDTLRAGETASFSFTLFNGQDLANSAVNVSVLGKDKSILASAQGDIDGKGTLSSGRSPGGAGRRRRESDRQRVRRDGRGQDRAGPQLVLESDKPIYKPGRRCTCGWGPGLRAEPVSTEAVIEIEDAKAIANGSMNAALDVDTDREHVRCRKYVDRSGIAGPVPFLQSPSSSRLFHRIESPQAGREYVDVEACMREGSALRCTEASAGPIHVLLHFRNAIGRCRHQTAHAAEKFAQ